MAQMTSSHINITDRLLRLAAGLSVILAIWLTVALLITVQNYVSAQVSGNPMSWGQSLSANIPWYLAWALLTPAIIALARRYDYRQGETIRFLGIHLPAAIVMAVSHALLYVGMATWLNRDNPHFPDSSDLLLRKLSASIHINLMIYALIVGLMVAGRAYARLRDQEVMAARMQIRLAESETAVLRAQLQPHFMFNTLNAISALVREDPARATSLIARLGDLLRLSINDRHRLTRTLSEELEFTEAYLAIETERLGERLRIVKDIDPGALTCQVPSLLLQPLVENAIRHGLAPLVRGGTLTIKAHLTPGCLRLTVADDGCGAADVADGVGLGNTRQCLRQLYGDKSSLTVTTAPDAGFEVVVEVPK